MPGGFQSFVILAGMRTGSNLLEATLASVAGISCYGEAFNPAFVGGPKRAELLGMTKADRERDPFALLSAIQRSPGLSGFRYFHDHDPRVLSAILDDRSCAKIVLSRNPVDSYLSLGIARTTGQWRLTDLKHRKSAQPAFDPAGFDDFLNARDRFHRTILHALQASGQTAFFLDYADLRDTGILNGLLSWLGVGTRLESVPESLVVQNPEPAEDKVANPAVLRKAVAEADPFGTSAIPVFEPRRGPMTRHFVLAGAAPVLYQPIPGTSDTAVRDWLATLGAGPRSGLSQAELKDWLRGHADHMAFSLAEHPVLRAWTAYSLAEEQLPPEVRSDLSAVYGVEFAGEQGIGAADGTPEGFISFLRFLKGNLGGQTGLAVRPEWASQSAILDGFRQVLSPRFVLRPEEFQAWAEGIGGKAGPVRAADVLPAWLADPDVEKAARQAYARDYLQLGFGPYAA